jgi:hypothetical protein
MHSSQLEKCLIDITTLQASKTDQLAFEAYIESVDTKVKAISEFTEMSRNMVQGCENYLEKYQPLFVHRQITEALDYVITNVKQKWRVKKYGESKGNFYTDKILSDDGNPDLGGVVERAQYSVRTG